METNAIAPGTSVSADAPNDIGDARNPRTLLFLGMVVGPLYLAVGLAQALVREGFDLSRHPLSLLANGAWGWVQTANFVVGGLMVIAVAVGLSRALRPHSRAMAWFLGAFGASMIVAAIFTADPVDGFPVGTPEGFPTTVSTAGMIHFIAGALGFLALAVSCFLASAALSRRKDRAMARLSLLSGLIIIIGFISPAFLSGGAAGTSGIWVSVVMGWTWLALLSAHLRRGPAGR